jgi:hypothetical protein
MKNIFLVRKQLRILKFLNPGAAVKRQIVEKTYSYVVNLLLFIYLYQCIIFVRFPGRFGNLKKNCHLFYCFRFGIWMLKEKGPRLWIWNAKIRIWADLHPEQRLMFSLTSFF